MGKILKGIIISRNYLVLKRYKNVILKVYIIYQLELALLYLPNYMISLFMIKWGTFENYKKKTNGKLVKFYKK